MVSAKHIGISFIAHMFVISAALIMAGSRDLNKNNFIIVLFFEDRSGRYETSVHSSPAHPSSSPLKKGEKREVTIGTEKGVELRSTDKSSQNLINTEMTQSLLQHFSGIYFETLMQSKIKDDENNPPSSPPFGKGGMGEFSGGDADHRGSLTQSSSGLPQHSVNYDSLIHTIRRAIQENLVYPLMAVRKRMEGTVVAGFTINSEGVPENIRVIKSSGFPVLDSAARETIVRASPLPVVRGNLEIPITFRLKREE